MDLVRPALRYLPGYVDALRRGWSPDNRRPAAAQEQLVQIAEDAERFLQLQEDREARGGAVILADGSEAPRLPGYVRWLWDGEFCGSIAFRWQPGTTELPAYCPGHIGYSVVPWKQRRGYATRALALLLAEVRQEGLEFVELHTEAGNVASQRVIENNGGSVVARSKSDLHHGSESLRYRIYLGAADRQPVLETSG